MGIGPEKLGADNKYCTDLRLAASLLQALD
jgi:hypothetical protein